MAKKIRQIRTNFKVPDLVGKALEVDADNHDRTMSKHIKELVVERYDSDKIASLLKKHQPKKPRQ